VRLLLWLLIGLAVVWLVKGLRRPVDPAARAAPEADRQPAAPPVSPSAAAANGVQLMVRCAHCGVHLPARDALADRAGQVFCGAAHRDAGPRAASRD
jgi:uncharacterized protein